LIMLDNLMATLIKVLLLQVYVVWVKA